jgi:hypothetical protein
MATLNRGPARIYNFPPRGRFAAVTSQHDEASNPQRAPVRAEKVASASSWYHEEAIREDRSRTN